jgi:serine/threonine protein kinase
MSAILEDRYEFIARAAVGSCAEVFKGRDKSSGDVVAIKRMKTFHAEGGFPMHVMREVKSLRRVTHENIVHFRQVVTGRFDDGIYLVFDYCEYDLAALLIATPLTDVQVPCYMRQIFLALGALGQNGWMHRDLKPANILLTPSNVVKLADFGLAKPSDDPRTMHRHTNDVITIWYRPPELLMGVKSYGPEVDIWSAGCVFYEMLTRRVLFQATMNSPAQEIDVIFRIHGFPGPEVWKAWEHCPDAPVYRRQRSATNITFADFLDRTLPPSSEEAKDLLVRMLEYDASKRIAVQDILQHPYVVRHALLPDSLPLLTFPEQHLQMPAIPPARPKRAAAKSRARTQAVLPRPADLVVVR